MWVPVDTWVLTRENGCADHDLLQAEIVKPVFSKKSNVLCGKGLKLHLPAQRSKYLTTVSNLYATLTRAEYSNFPRHNLTPPELALKSTAVAVFIKASRPFLTGQNLCPRNA